MANFEAKLSKAVYSAVSKSVYGIAQLQAPKESEAKKDEDDDSKDIKRSVHPPKEDKSLVLPASQLHADASSSTHLNSHYLCQRLRASMKPNGALKIVAETDLMTLVIDGDPRRGYAI